MRPINLIPPDERRSHGDSRTGPLAYILVGGLAVILIGIVILVLTSNQISDRKDEVAGLEGQKAAAVAKAESLAPYTSFESVSQQRTATIAELADGRFDWARVIRQLSLVLPPGVYFSSVTGSAGGGTGESEAGLEAPSLTLSGCAPGQPMVAAFVASLKDIDGVTRVGLKTSNTASEGGSEAGDACSQPGVALFEVVVAFDGAPSSLDGTESTLEAPTEAAESAGSETEESSEAESGEGESEAGEESESSTTEASASAGGSEAAG